MKAKGTATARLAFSDGLLCVVATEARRVISFSFSVWTCSIRKQQEDDRKVVKTGLVLQTIK